MSWKMIYKLVKINLRLSCHLNVFVFSSFLFRFHLGNSIFLRLINISLLLNDWNMMCESLWHQMAFGWMQSLPGWTTNEQYFDWSFERRHLTRETQTSLKCHMNWIRKSERALGGFKILSQVDTQYIPIERKVLQKSYDRFKHLEAAGDCVIENFSFAGEGIDFIAKRMNIELRSFFTLTMPASRVKLSQL